jgi:hypothetical protein
MSVSIWEVRRWRREVSRLRKQLNKLEAKLDLYSRLETDVEELENAALMRTDIILLREQLAQMEEKIKSVRPSILSWMSDETLLAIISAATGLFLLILIAFYVFPALLGR